MTSLYTHAAVGAEEQDDNKRIPPGPALALSRKGAQDKHERTYISSPSERPDLTHEGFYDIRKDVLKGEHVWTYGKLDADTKMDTTMWGGGKCMRFLLKRTCDWINGVELALPNPENEFGFNSMIKQVETEIGEQRLDVFRMTSDLEAQVETQFAILNPAERGRRRAISQVNGTTFVLLTMAPFHTTNLTQPSTKYHGLQITVTFCDEYVSKLFMRDLLEKVSLFGNKYYQVLPEREKYTESLSMEQLTFQNQYTGQERCCTQKYNNSCFPQIEYNLCLNHPVVALYFWGVDKNHIREVKIVCKDGIVLFESDIDALEHYKQSKGINVSPVVFFFCDADNILLPGAPSLNFSRFDKVNLVITLTPQCEKSYDLDVGGVNKQIIRYAAGMCGLRFSK